MPLPLRAAPPPPRQRGRWTGGAEGPSRARTSVPEPGAGLCPRSRSPARAQPPLTQAGAPRGSAAPLPSPALAPAARSAPLHPRTGLLCLAFIRCGLCREGGRRVRVAELTALGARRAWPIVRPVLASSFAGGAMGGGGTPGHCTLQTFIFPAPRPPFSQANKAP